MSKIDLTHEIEEEMPVFPGTEKPTLENICTLENDGFREKLLSMYSHTGTHMDAPAHIIANGKTLSDFLIDQFVGKGLALDFSHITNKRIQQVDLEKYKDQLKETDFLLIFVDWYKHWGSDYYFSSFPTLSPEAAKWLTQFSLKGIGVDVISLDPVDAEIFEVHQILLGEGLLLIENLKNVDQLINKAFEFVALPLKIRDGDGSPVRAFATLSE